MIQGELSQDPGIIIGEIVEYYKKLYSEITSWRPNYMFPNCPRLIDEEKKVTKGF